MSQVANSGVTPPATYTMYGKTYNFDDFQREADEGFDAYLSGLKRGEKDADLFREAYANMMNGIKDGTITFENGHYHDSKGRWTNSKKKHKDYYGLVANYIYSKQGKNGEAESNWDGSTSISKDLTKLIYNSDTGNIQDFIDLDPIDEKTNTRGITKRTDFLRSAFLKIADTFDSRYSGYTADEKTEALNNINAAIQALQDGTIDAGDYLALTRAANGLDFRTMFGDTSSTPTTIPDSETPVIADNNAALAQKALENTQDEAWNSAVTEASQLFPELTNPYSETLLSLTSDNVKYYASANKSLSNTDLQNIISKNISKPDSVNWIYLSNGLKVKANRSRNLTTLLILAKKRGLLKLVSSDNSDLYYIPWLYNKKKFSYYVWDRSTGQIKEVSGHDIPEGLEQINKFFTSKGFGKGSDKFATYRQVPSQKQGGILKASGGASVTKTNTNIYSGGNSDLSYGGEYLTSVVNHPLFINWLSRWSGDNAMSDYLTFVQDNVNGRRTFGINDYANDLTYTSNEGVKTFNTNFLKNSRLLNYSLFGANMDDYTNMTPWNPNTNKGAIVYGLTNYIRPNQSINTGDSYHTNPETDYIDGAKGLQTYSRIASYTNPNMKSGDFGEWGKYWQKFGATGAYYYVSPGDASGRGQWIPTSDTSLNKYTPFNADSVLDTTLHIPKGAVDKTIAQASDIDLTKEEHNKVDWDKIANQAKGLVPDMIGASRLGYSLWTNNKVYDTLRRSLNPVLKNTHELYSPVRGAFSEMQAQYRQAANTNRLGDRIANSTTDSQVGVAAKLDANRQAADLRYQGRLADDKEILRTSQEALKRQEDNIARRMATANENMENINKTNREIAELKATRYKSNWQSIDNYLAEIEGRKRENWLENKARGQQFAQQVALDNINTQVTNYLESYKQRYMAAAMRDPNSIDTYKAYLDYARKSKEIEDWMVTQLRLLYANIYGLSYSNPYAGMNISDYVTEMRKLKLKANESK